MGFNKTRQYRPITIAQTSKNDPISTHAVLDLTDSINNYLYYAGRFKMFGTFFAPDNVTLTKYLYCDYDSEVVVAFLGKHYWNPAYNYIRFWAYGNLGGLPGPGEEDYGTITVYASSNPYIGDAIYDTNILHNIKSASATIDSTAADACTNKITMHPGLGDSWGWIYLICTLKVTTASNMNINIKSLDIQPEY